MLMTPIRQVGIITIIFTILFTAGLRTPLLADGITLWAGPAFEYNFYGQPGLFIEGCSGTIFGGHPHVRLQYTTSRLSFWHGEYDLSVDDYYLSALWCFRPGKRINPHVGIDFGMTHFDDELLPDLDNNAIRFNMRAGVQSSLLDGRLKPYADGGAVIITSSTTFLFLFSCGVGYTIPTGGWL